MVQYNTILQYDNDWGKVRSRDYIHEIHPIPRPHGQTMGYVFCEDLGENWPRYNGTTLYYFRQIILTLGEL